MLPPPPVETISIIGSAYNGWEEDLIMETVDGEHYYLYNITLQPGELKFRLDLDWTSNWGGESFPQGIGVQDGKNINILISSIYTIEFNKTTGAYSFIHECGPCNELDSIPVCAGGIMYGNSCMAECAGYTNWTEDDCLEIIPVISIIGDAALGWDEDINMNTEDGVNYTLQGLNLTIGEFKFRENHTWTNNWGGTEFPCGIASPGDVSISIMEDGPYNIYFNRETLGYSFNYVPFHYMEGIYPEEGPVCVDGISFPSSCGAIQTGHTNWTEGECTPNEKKVWLDEHILYSVDENGNYEAKNIIFNGYSNLLFIASFGNYSPFIVTNFPTGVAETFFEQDNLSIEGTYNIFYNINTKKYRFERLDCFCPTTFDPVCFNGIIYANSCEAECVGITNWTQGPCTSVYLVDSTLNQKIELDYFSLRYSSVVSIKSGDFFFEKNDGNTVSHYTHSDFPSGTAKLDHDTKISVKEGIYIVSYDIETNKYSFTPKFNVNVSDKKLTQVDDQGNYEIKNVTFNTPSNLSFEVTENQPFIVTPPLIAKYNMSFPSGTATLRPRNEYLDLYMLIDYTQNYTTIPAGTYDIYYNTSTREYRFVSLDCVCPTLDKPVCANGVTYPNACEAECAGETDWFDSPCETLRKHVTLKSNSDPSIDINLYEDGGSFYPDSFVSNVAWLDSRDYYFEIQLYDNQGNSQTYKAAVGKHEGQATKDYNSLIKINNKGFYTISYLKDTDSYYFEPTYQVSFENFYMSPIDSGGNYKAENLKLENQKINFMILSNMTIDNLYGEEYPIGETKYDHNSEKTGINIPNGTYNVYFNIFTREYTFEQIDPNKDISVYLYQQDVEGYIQLQFKDGRYQAKGKKLQKEVMYFTVNHNGEQEFKLGGENFPKGTSVSLNDTNGITPIEEGIYDIFFEYDGIENSTYDFILKTKSRANYQASNFKIYPNPTIDGIVNFSETIDIKLFNLSGQVILEYDQVQSIDISHLPKGIYILQSYLNNEFLISKLIKE